MRRIGWKKVSTIRIYQNNDEYYFLDVAHHDKEFDQEMLVEVLQQFIGINDDGVVAMMKAIKEAMAQS